MIPNSLFIQARQNVPGKREELVALLSPKVNSIAFRLVTYLKTSPDEIKSDMWYYIVTTIPHLKIIGNTEAYLYHYAKINAIKEAKRRKAKDYCLDEMEILAKEVDEYFIPDLTNAPNDDSIVIRQITQSLLTLEEQELLFLHLAGYEGTEIAKIKGYSSRWFRYKFKPIREKLYPKIKEISYA